MSNFRLPYRIKPVLAGGMHWYRAGLVDRQQVIGILDDADLADQYRVLVPVHEARDLVGVLDAVVRLDDLVVHAYLAAAKHVAQCVRTVYTELLLVDVVYRSALPVD